MCIRDRYVYAASYYYMEANTASMLKALNVSYDVSDTAIENKGRADHRS